MFYFSGSGVLFIAAVILIPVSFMFVFHSRQWRHFLVENLRNYSESFIPGDYSSFHNCGILSDRTSCRKRGEFFFEIYTLLMGYFSSLNVFFILLLTFLGIYGTRKIGNFFYYFCNKANVTWCYPVLILSPWISDFWSE